MTAAEAYRAAAQSVRDLADEIGTVELELVYRRIWDLSEELDRLAGQQEAQ